MQTTSYHLEVVRGPLGTPLACLWRGAPRPALGPLWRTLGVAAELLGPLLDTLPFLFDLLLGLGPPLGPHLGAWGVLGTLLDALGTLPVERVGHPSGDQGWKMVEGD